MAAARGTARTGATVAGYSAEAQQFFDRITDPGTTRKGHYATLIDAIVTAGVWAKLDCLWILAADIAGNAHVNLKAATFTLTLQSTPTFETDRGYTGNGTSTWLKTGYTPSTAGGVLTLNSASFGIWFRTDPAGANWLGGDQGTANQFRLNRNKTLERLAGSINDTGQVEKTTVPSATGLLAINRSASTAIQLYMNGSSVATDTDVSTALCARELMLGQVPGAGGAVNQLSAAFIGGSLDATENAAVNTNLATYMTAVGA
jgi:hypothetical protein